MTTLLTPPTATPPTRRRHRWVYAALGILFAVAALGLVVANRDDSTTPAPTSTTSATEPPTTAPTTPSTDVPPVVDDTQMVFPDGASTVRFDDPLVVARSFATELVGFDDPVVGEYRGGDARSGEVEIRPTANGPVTTVFVRQLVGDDWWVIGSATASIEVADPSALDTVEAPVRLRGVSTAFEANVEVAVRQDGTDAPIGLGFVMGGANGEMGPFDSVLEFSVPSTDLGTILFTTRSMENGAAWEASVLRVRFGTTSACGGLPAPLAPASGEQAVHVYFTCGDDVDGEPVAVVRSVAQTTGVLRAALDALLAGPSAAERDAGFTSWFSADTKGMVASVDLSSIGDAVVDFDDLRPVIPNASASAGSQLLLSQLDATVFQFPTVRSVEYRIEGDCAAFFEWLQLAGCEPRRETT